MRENLKYESLTLTVHCPERNTETLTCERFLQGHRDVQLRVQSQLAQVLLLAPPLIKV